MQLNINLKGTEICFFVGKSIHNEKISDLVTIELLQPLLFEYGKALRPKDLTGPALITKELEVLFGPGNSEMDVAQNKIPLTVLSCKNDRPYISSSDIGYEPEVYTNGEEGFRCRRDQDGLPTLKKFEVTYAQGDYSENSSVDITKT